MYNVPLALQCIHGCNDGGEKGDGKEGSEISRGREGVELTWPLVCR